MLTNARIEQIEQSRASYSGKGKEERNARAESKALDLEGYGWISALRGDQIRKLVESGDLQPELFDQRALAEIVSEEHYPGERLVVCRNPVLAEERARKREGLLAITEEKLRVIQEATRRANNPYPGKGGSVRIGRRIERECGKYKMLKHFKLNMSQSTFSFERQERSIAWEAVLDGFYIVRAGRVSPREMKAEQLVETYKMLSRVERDFRVMKTTALRVRPIFHREEDMVRAHIFVCMLACHLRWHMEAKLKPALFYDEQPGGEPRENPVAKAERSERAKIKAATKKTEDRVGVTGVTRHPSHTTVRAVFRIRRLDGVGS